MRDIYEICPAFENERFILRLVEKDDYKQLLKVYSDPSALPFFNGDNCNGDDFHYQTEERMKSAVDFWVTAYGEKWFVRWTIVDKTRAEAIGTIELFHRDADDYFNNCGLLRLDLRGDYEKADEIKSILSLILNAAFDGFYCDKIATKAIPRATERIAALKSLGFEKTEEKLIGHDGTEYGDYFVLLKK